MPSYREPPIPPFVVGVSHDGVTNWEIDLPQAWGTREQCAEFIAAHLPPKGAEFTIICTDTGREVSYLIPPSNTERVRLQWQDTHPIT